MTGKLSKNFHGVGIGPLSKILAVKYSTLLLPLAQRFQITKTRQKLVHLMLWFHEIFQASFSGFQQIHTISVSGHFIHSCSCFKLLQGQGWSILRIFLGRFLRFGPIVAYAVTLGFTLWWNKQDGNFHMYVSFNTMVIQAVEFFYVKNHRNEEYQFDIDIFW